MLNLQPVQILGLQRHKQANRVGHYNDPIFQPGLPHQPALKHRLSRDEWGVHWGHTVHWTVSSVHNPDI